MNELRWCSRPVIGLLLTAGAASVVAFELAPRVLLDGPLRPGTGLRETAGRGLVEYWQGGGPAFPPLLASLVDYWFRWHALKVAVSSAMLVVFVLLAVVLWRRYLHGMARRAIGAIGATVAAVGATGLLIFNIQATAVPLIALLPLLSEGPPGPDLTRTLDEMRDGLTHPAGAHGGSAALPVLLGAVERYYWVLAAVSATAMAAAGLAILFLWRRRRTGSARAGVLRKALGISMALTAVLLGVLVAAAVYSATEPADALLGLLGMA